MLEEWFNLSYFHTTFLGFWWNVLYIVPYLGCLFYIIQKKDEELKQIFVWPFFISLVTIFNPFIMEWVLKKLGWRDRYSRFYWIITVMFLCAFMGAKLIVKQKKGAERNILVLFLLCFLYLCSGRATAIELDDNVYKIDQSVIEVSDMIGRNKDTKNPVVLCDADLYYWLRQYDPSVVLAVSNKVMDLYRFQSASGIDPEEQYKNNKRALSMFTRGVEIDPETANKLLKKNKVQYFVRNTEYYSDYYMDLLDLVYVDKVDGYELYRCNND